MLTFYIANNFFFQNITRQEESNNVLAKITANELFLQFFFPVEICSYFAVNV